VNRWRQGIWLSAIGAAVVIFGYWGCFTGSGIRSFEGSEGVFPLLCVLLGPVLTFIGLTLLSLDEIRWDDPFPGEGPDPMFAFALAMLLTWFTASLDLALPPDFNPAAMYALPLLILSRIATSRYLWYAAMVLITLVVVGNFAGPSIDSFRALVMAAVNRGIVVVALLAMTTLLNRRSRNAASSAPPTDSTIQ
jgi:hypothetical protein